MQQSAVLDIYLPKIDGHINDLPFSLKRASIQRWVDGLPLVNTGETVKKIYQVLVSTNRCQLSPSKLIIVLEILRTPINRTVQTLSKYFINAPHPLLTKGKQIAKLTAEIYKEMSIGYKRIIKTLAINTSTPPSLPMLSSLQNALYYLSSLLVTLKQTYSPSCKNTWKEIHQIYHYAEANKLHHIEVENTPRENASRITTRISDIYKTILLLSIANPSRLNGEQISTLHSALDDYANLVSIKQSTDTENPTGQFVINLDEGSKPIPLALYKKEITPSTRIVNTTKVTEHLKKEIKSTHSQSKNGSLKELLEFLIPAWEASNKRKTLRSKKESSHNIAIGLTASYRKLQKETTEAKPLLAFCDSDKKEPMNTELLTANDGAELLVANDDETYKQFNVQACTIIGRSSKGYSLEWNGDKSQLIRIGELITINEKKDTSLCNICLVRWIQHTTTGNLQFGVQLLSSTAQAVKAKVYDKNNPNIKAMLECLLIPSSQLLTIITPRLFRIGQHLSIEFDSEKHRIELTQQMRSETSFKQFQYTTISKQGEEPKAGRTFSSAWASI